MARSKYTVAVLLALLAIVATLQPSEARVQPAAAANQEEATATTTADGGSPSLPGLPLPQIPGMPTPTSSDPRLAAAVRAAPWWCTGRPSIPCTA